MSLRPYQNQALNNILSRRDSGVRRQLVSMATGTGKTVVLANLMPHMPKGAQSHVIAHRDELIQQAAEKIAFWNPKLNIDIEMGKSQASAHADVIVSSIQTIINQERLHRFDPNNVAWLIVDEAHHSSSSTYVEVINYFLTSTNTTLVGVTATSQRADGIALASVFDEVVFHYSMQDGIQDGYLSDVHGFSLKTGVDISGVRASKSDDGGFNQKQLVSLINTPKRNEMIVKAWIERMWPRQTVAFTEDIQHAKDLAAAFQRQGVRAEAVWGKSKKHGEPNRKAKLAAFESGEIQVLVNAQLLTEGWDVWQVEGIIIAAPTKSQAKFIQMVGRGTRLHFGISNLNEWRADGRLTDEHKQNFLVMDTVDNLGKHSLVTLPTLFGLSPKLDLNGMSASVVAAMVEKAREMNPNADFSVMEELGQFDAVIQKANMWEMRFAEDTKDFSGLQWRKDGNGIFRLTFPGGFFRVLGDITGKWDVQGKITFTEGGKTNTTRYDQEHFKSLADAIAYSEQIISKEKSDVLRMLGRNARWLKDPVSAGQLKILERMKIPGEQIVKMTKGQANDMINNFFKHHRRG